MKIKSLIVICIILIIVLFGAIVIIPRDSNEPFDESISDEEDVDEMSNDIEVTIKNSTGKKINSLYIFQDDNEAYIDDEGDQKWIELIADKTFDEDEEDKAFIEKVEQGGNWDFRIVTDDGEYEMKETIGEDFVYENATLEFIINDGHLDIKDNDLTADDVINEDEDNTENETDNQKNTEDEKVEDDSENTKE